MKVTVAELRILALEEQHSMDRAEGLAWARKAEAFGTIAKLFSRPKDDDFELIYKERRYQPFWHISCKAFYGYERQGQYQVAMRGPEVKSVTIQGTDYDVQSSIVSLIGVEHCAETASVEYYVDGLSGTKQASLAEYINFPGRVIGLQDLAALRSEGAIVVPPQLASTGIVRDAVGGLVKRVVADEITEEVLEVEKLDLYYRPVYTFQYRWISKAREAMMEYDALTGKFSTDGKGYQEYGDATVDAELVTGPDAETVAQLVPGGQLAVKAEAPPTRKRS